MPCARVRCARPVAPLTAVPSRKPFLNLLGMVFKCRMRPVPSVRLLSALWAQLYFLMPARG